MSNAVTETPARESKIDYIGKRISKKQAKLYLNFTPKHGPISRRTMQYYLGLTKAPPGPAVQPNSKKKDKK